jgi:penicillin amidase
MSWRWTGFEPTDEFVALDAVVHARSYEDFKEALDHFGVGAQNWVYADRAGNIGWYPSHQLPIREHIAAGDWTHPPFLPMPGEGGAEWDGFVPREELPQSYNPTRGYLVTANADPTGVSFDGDPFNDGHYLGYMWTPGFRMERASERVAELVSRGEITPEEMAAVQADDRSNVGVRLRAYFVEALKAAESGATPEVAGLSTPQLVSVRELLEGWDLRAMSGVGAEPASSAANSAAATLIFNVSLTYLIERLLDDEGLATLPDRVLIRLLLRIFEEPSALVSWDPEQEQSRFCDDQDTPDVVEKCTTLLVLSTLDAVAWLASEEGGGRTEIADWRWGDFHTVRLRHPVVPLYDIPPTAEHVRGYPRPGDNFGVDASPPGLKDRDFSTGHGPAVRHVLEMLDTVTRMGSIAGGQREDPRGEYYRDQMDQWVENEAPMVPYALEDVLEQRTRVLDLMPPIPSP